MPDDIRKGRQTPTVSRVLPYTESRGEEAVNCTTSPAAPRRNGRKA